MRIEVDIPDKDESYTLKYQEIIASLIGSGALDLKNGKAVLHFDSDGTFQGIQIDYWAFRRRRQK